MNGDDEDEDDDEDKDDDDGAVLAGTRNSQPDGHPPPTMNTVRGCRNQYAGGVVAAAASDAFREAAAPPNLCSRAKLPLGAGCTVARLAAPISTTTLFFIRKNLVTSVPIRKQLTISSMPTTWRNRSSMESVPLGE